MSRHSGICGKYEVKLWKEMILVSFIIKTLHWHF
jgi:hypothetical protein